jgi:hypothetical protein
MKLSPSAGKLFAIRLFTSACTSSPATAFNAMHQIAADRVPLRTMRVLRGSFFGLLRKRLRNED